MELESHGNALIFPVVNATVIDEVEDVGRLQGVVFKSLFPPPPGSSSVVSVMHTKHEFLATNVSVPSYEAVSSRGILRTSFAHADRSVVLGYFQLADINHNTRVSTEGLGVNLTLTTGNLQMTYPCNTSGLVSAADHYLGLCHVPSLPHAWFESGAVATAELFFTYNGTEIERRPLDGSIQLHERPPWFGPKVETLGQGSTRRMLSAPAANDWMKATFSNEGEKAYALLPVSPVFAGEEFTLQVFANTGSFALGSFHVWISFNPTKMEYLSHSTSLFQGMTREGTASQLQFQVSGLASDTTEEMVTGSSVPIFSVQMRMKAGLPDGVHRNLLTVFTLEMVSTAAVSFGFGTPGFILDHRSTSGPTTAQAEMVIKSPQVVGIFAYASTGTLGNTATLSGKTLYYPLTVVKTQEIDTVPNDAEVLTKGAECVKGVPAESSAYHIAKCTLVVSPDCKGHLTNASVDVSYQSLSTSVVFTVYYPTDVKVSVADPILNKIDLNLPPSPPPPASPPPPPPTQARRELTGKNVLAAVPPSAPSKGVDAGGKEVEDGGIFCPVYQWTKISLEVDGLDATNLIDEYAVSDPSVVRLSRITKLNGMARGTSLVYLPGNPLVNTTIDVSDETVTVAQFHSRLLTNVVWHDKPPDDIRQTYIFDSSAMMIHSMTTEGAGGRIVARAEWSDGIAINVPFNYYPGIDELNITALSSRDLHVNWNADDLFWEAVVPFMAMYKVGELFYTEWRYFSLLTSFDTLALPFLCMGLPTPYHIPMLTNHVPCLLRRLRSTGYATL